VSVATVRAFAPAGRMSALSSKVSENWPLGYRFQPFEVTTTNLEFSFCRRPTSEEIKVTPSNITAVFTTRLQETLIGGVLQGRKQGDPRAASAISRKAMWQAVADVARALGSPVLLDAIQQDSYGEFKSQNIFEDRRKVAGDVKKMVLQGWVPNSGDEVFRLNVGWEESVSA